MRGHLANSINGELRLTHYPCIFESFGNRSAGFTIRAQFASTFINGNYAINPSYCRESADPLAFFMGATAAIAVHTFSVVRQKMPLLRFQFA